MNWNALFSLAVAVALTGCATMSGSTEQANRLPERNTKAEPVLTANSTYRFTASTFFSDPDGDSVYITYALVQGGSGSVHLDNGVATVAVDSVPRRFLVAITVFVSDGHDEIGTSLLFGIRRGRRPWESGLARADAVMLAARGRIPRHSTGDSFGRAVCHRRVHPPAPPSDTSLTTSTVCTPSSSVSRKAMRPPGPNALGMRRSS